MSINTYEMDDVPMTIGEVLSRLSTASWDDLCHLLRSPNPIIRDAAAEQMEKRRRKQG